MFAPVGSFASQGCSYCTSVDWWAMHVRQRPTFLQNFPFPARAPIRKEPLLRYVSRGHSSSRNDLEPRESKCGRCGVMPGDPHRGGVAAGLTRSLTAAAPRD